MSHDQSRIGKTVHYVSEGSPVKPDGTQKYESTCRAAVITEENGSDVGLAVLNPTGFFFNRDVPYDAGGEVPGDSDCPSARNHGNPFRYCACGWVEARYSGGTWHWPERIGE
jgi:hypothetical protein